MNTNEFTTETKFLLIRFQLATEQYERDFQLADEWLASIEGLQESPDEAVRTLAQRIDTKANILSISDEDFGPMMDAQHELMRLSHQIRDDRPAEVKKTLN